MLSSFRLLGPLIEMKQKLDWAANHQKELKAEKYQGLVDSLNNKDDMTEVGTRIILPATIEQTPRRYNELFQGNYNLQISITPLFRKIE